MMASQVVLFSAFVFLLYISPGDSIQCFQCDSNEDISCPNDEPFDTSVNAKVDCNSFEAHTPGQFCVKIVQESPGWRGWKKVTRRCGSRTDFGVAWGCRWSWDYTGVFRETCYCETSDGCNGVDRISTGFFLSIICCLVTHIYYKLF